MSLYQFLKAATATQRGQLDSLKAEYEEALDAQDDAKSRVERLEGRLRRLTGCDCASIGLECKGHEVDGKV